MFKNSSSENLKEQEIAFISTMNIELFNNFGKKFLSSFDENAHTKIKLFNIFEGSNNISFGSDRIIQKIFYDEVHRTFLKHFSPLYEANGHRLQFIKEGERYKINYNYDFRWNAIKFSFKVFAINFCLQFINDEKYLIWTDADLICRRKFDANSLIEFIPNQDELFSYLARSHYPPKNPFSECGFIIFNLKHNEFKNFIKRMIEIYSSGEIFSIQQWHDSWIWDHVRKEFENKKKTKFKNISGLYTNTEHPFVNCGLGEYFDHLKGDDRKKNGKSFEDDYVKS